MNTGPHPDPGPHPEPETDSQIIISELRILNQKVDNLYIILERMSLDLQDAIQELVAIRRK